MRLILRRLRGALGNAVVWGVGWFAAGFALILGYSFFGPRPVALSWELLRYTLQGATQIALAGAVAGGVFSAYIAANFRNKGLQEVTPARFAMGGGLVTVLLVLGLSLWSSLRSDWPLFLSDLVEPVLTFGSIGVITSYGSIKLARRALTEGPATAPELGTSSKELLPGPESEAV